MMAMQIRDGFGNLSAVLRLRSTGGWMNRIVIDLHHLSLEHRSAYKRAYEKQH